MFPDGLLASEWIENHQEHVPSAVISFYAFTADADQAASYDTAIKEDINKVKRLLSSSGYRTRFVVVLIGDNSTSPLDIDDRLTQIRRSTGLDSKTSFFFLPFKSSELEVRAFAETIIRTTYPTCLEYYRDHSKHSRRKRNRSVTPPPTSPPTSGTSKILTAHGWNVRYDMKLGVFAEFRQEMDDALHCYESAYDGLLSSDVIETIAVWSPRWNEARHLADVLAIRSLRCLLWNGSLASAVRRWQLHRFKTRDIIDRRGKGSLTYGWEAWESRWAMIMGQMVQRTDLFSSDPSELSIFLDPEKSIAVGERLQPWEHLHHPGYWFRQALTHRLARRSRALAIPEEDRALPDSSLPSHANSKTYTYDTYLCPEPNEEYPLLDCLGVDHGLETDDLLNITIAEFVRRDQSRLVQVLQLQSAKENIRREAWNDAYRIIRPLWQDMTFRKEQWWDIVEDIGWTCR